MPRATRKGLQVQIAPPSTDPQYKVQKGDAAYLVQLLMDLGLQVTHRGDRINAFHPKTREYVCGFTWHKATDTLPGRWSFDMALLDVFSLTDLKLTITTLKRVRSLREHAQKAWVAFQDTKSEKRWGVYLGILVAMFHTPTASPKPPSGDTDNG